MTNARIRGLILVLLLLSPVLLAVPAQASPPETKNATYSPSELAITAHLQSMLVSKDEAMRLAALQDINLLAFQAHHERQAVLHLNAGVLHNGWTGDLTVMAPYLVHAFAAEPTPAGRMMAANALYLIGDENSLEKLIALNGQERNATVKQRTNRFLARYFSERYPELSTKKKITTTSIHKARRAAMRAG